VSKPKLISLFTGAGGLDFGFEAAGFETSAAVEIDADCCSTLRANRDWPIIERSIYDIDTKELLDAGRLEAGDVDLLIGGPPCQPFSKSGFWATGATQRLADPRASTLSAYLRVVEEALPRVFLIENVPGFAFARKDEALALILKRIAEINRRTGAAYRPTYAILNAADFGVPQLRERFFLVACREGREFAFPSPSHGNPDQPHNSAWSAIGDISPDDDEDLRITGKWADLIPSIPEGRNYLWHTRRGGGEPLFGWRCRYWTFLLKLAKAKPSWTIQAQPGPSCGPFHWDNRRLSIRELCRLQTFPDDITISGNRHSQQRQIGNAVPSLLAEVLGRAIGEQLLGRQMSETPKLLPPNETLPPRARRRSAMPASYTPLLGKHADHPGTGKGRGARARARRRTSK
jgi:DNA (cytosine-5)-methyltransferase 1